MDTLAALGLALYLLPWLVAMARRHHQRAAIGVLTVLLGWTGLGWALALVWATTAVRPDLAPPPRPRPVTGNLFVDSLEAAKRWPFR